MTASLVELAIRIGVLALLLYASVVLVSPFASIAVWSVVLTISLYPIFSWIASRLGGRRPLAAFLTTILTLLVIIIPATWLALSFIDSIRMISSELDFSAVEFPQPPERIRDWPLIGNAIYEAWEFASSNFSAALIKVAPYLKPLGSNLLALTASAGTGILKFFVAIVIAGFLFSPAPSLVQATKRFARKLAAERGEDFVALAGATIRTVSRGVVGISVLQAVLAGVGLTMAGVPGASLIASAALILAIIQIGPSIVLIPVIIWSWFAMDTTTALLFTAYMVPVNLLDNILRPIVMGRGLKTPMLVIFLGVLGGTLAYGITGLFLGPIVLAVIWELLVAWIEEPAVAETVPVRPA
jgi:predicted PurR-regulated permease PerM